jgi:hypothetical protein
MKSSRIKLQRFGFSGIALLLGCLLLSSCGQPSVKAGGGDLASAPTPSGPAFDMVEPDFSAPVPNSETASDLDSAVALLPYEPLVPKGLGQPSRILVSRADTFAPADRAIGFVYDTPDFGRVDVVEHLQSISPQEYDAENKALLAENGKPTTHGSVQIINVRDGQQALITTSEDGKLSEIFWLERSNLEISILGPSLTSDDCQKLANSI